MLRDARDGIQDLGPALNGLALQLSHSVVKGMAVGLNDDLLPTLGNGLGQVADGLGPALNNAGRNLTKGMVTGAVDGMKDVVEPPLVRIETVAARLDTAAKRLDGFVLYIASTTELGRRMRWIPHCASVWKDPRSRVLQTIRDGFERIEVRDIVWQERDRRDFDARRFAGQVLDLPLLGLGNLGQVREQVSKFVGGLIEIGVGQVADLGPRT